MNVQFRLRYTGAAFVRLKPDSARIEKLIQEWIAGAELPRGVQVTATDWEAQAMDTEAVRARLKRRKRNYVGCPGIVKEYAAPGITMCDYDVDVAPELAHMWEMARGLRLVPVWTRYDRTARGWHLVIQWARELTAAETVAVQLLLGSDPRREMFNLARILSGGGKNERWNILFARKL